jgi:purine-binding chemotaxis protein CheW
MTFAADPTCVLFRIDEQWYGVPLQAVERVVRLVAITPAPQAPVLVLGVIDLQGTIVPVLDLRRRLELPDRLPTLDDRMIVVSAGSHRLAFVVDEVAGLLRPDVDRMTSAEDIGSGMSCLSAVAKTDTGMVLLLDLEHLLDIPSIGPAVGGVS